MAGSSVALAGAFRRAGSIGPFSSGLLCTGITPTDCYPDPEVSRLQGPAGGRVGWVMSVDTDVEPKPSTGCFACSALPPRDREACVGCRAPVGLPFAALVLEPAPVEPVARLEHLRRQAAVAAGAARYAAREAVYQDRWDRGHARDLRATSDLYGRAERRLRREIERVERQLRPATPKAASKPTTMSSRRAKSRRSPGRAARPARRVAAQRQQAGDDGGGDPPPGASEPASAHSHVTRGELITARSMAASAPGTIAAEDTPLHLVPALTMPSRLLATPIAVRSQATCRPGRDSTHGASQVPVAQGSHPRPFHCESCVRLRVRPASRGEVPWIACP